MKGMICVFALAAFCAYLHLPSAEAIQCYVGTPIPGSSLIGKGLTNTTCGNGVYTCKKTGVSAGVLSEYYSQCGDVGTQFSGQVINNCTGAKLTSAVQYCVCNVDLCNPADRSVPVSVAAAVAVAVATAFAANKWH